jgi:quercetin dioxygenase-like cupin family protein
MRFLALFWASSLIGMVSACGAQPPPAAISADSPPPAAGAAQASSAPGAAQASSAPAAGNPDRKADDGITRTLLDQSDLPEFPGWETRMYLIEYAPGVAAPRHHHPVGGIGYVVSGSFESAFEGGKTTVVHEGQSFRDLADVPHVTFKNTDTSKPLKFIVSYVVRKGTPVVVVP